LPGEAANVVLPVDNLRAPARIAINHRNEMSVALYFDPARLVRRWRLSMLKLALMLTTAAAIAALAMSARDAGAESAGEKIAVTCGGAIQNCPKGKKMYCNRWRPCKGRTAKVRRYCDAPICMTVRSGKE
jgi:hypothetical protein